MKRWNAKYPNRFNLDSNEDYLKWRDEKLAAYPKDVGGLVVELGDMTAITAAEKSKILETVERANMCVYTAGTAELAKAPGFAGGYLIFRNGKKQDQVLQ